MATPIPKTSAPAARAFAEAGIASLEQLATWSAKDLLALHGVGPKALRLLEPALREAGLTLRS